MKFYSKEGYTLVEIMIVVTIIVVIFAIAFPNYIKSGRISAKNVCINNLKQIDSAVEQWALENNIRPGLIPDAAQEEEIYAYIQGDRPICPSKGTYTFGEVGSKPQVRCSREDEGHKLPD